MIEDEDDDLEALDRATRRYHATEAAHEAARQESVAAVLRSLRRGRKPAVVVARSPFKDAHVRRLARDHGIPEYLLRRHPRARGELTARLPEWEQAAAAIGALGIGLDDAEYVGGELWYGLVKTASGTDAGDQKAVIAGRLARWATRDGGDAAAAAAAVQGVLDDYLPGH
jgi:hypothetical protein